MTQGILEELLAQGVRVPDDLSVVGFGDELGFRWWGPGLTTVGLPVHDLATACGLWFVHHVRQNSATASPYTSISPATLIVRGSTRKPGSPTKASVRASPRGATA
jgi:LacI family transcriptional regulator